MKAIRITLILAIATLIFCASATTAYAQSYIAGNLYRVYSGDMTHGVACAPDGVVKADPACVPDRSPDITFLVRTFLIGIPLDFWDKYPKSSELAEAWLTHSATNSAVNVMGIRDIQYDYMSEGRDYGSLIDFTGEVTVFNGEVFTFTIDDSVWLEINGYLVLNQQQPPGTYTGTYMGPNGTFPFRLIYTECCNAVNAQLTVTHN